MHRKVLLVFTVVATLTTVFAGTAGAQHGGSAGHLPASSQNVQLVGRGQVPGTDQTPGLVSDLAFNNTRFGQFAFVGEHSAGRSSPECTGAVHVFDVSNPSNPQYVRELPSHRDTYVTEGVQVLRNVQTEFFTGDLLILSNETCGPEGVGGLTIWDVTNPRRATRLSEGFGDFTFGDVFSDDTTPWAHDSHSALAWKKNSNVYAAMIDNDELLDVDIADITNPRRPKVIAETDIVELVEGGAEIEVNAYGDFPNAHDFAFGRIPVPDARKRGGVTHVLSVSYWDAGWMHLNVNNPKNPRFISDFNYPECDPEYGVCPPEGNAHQSEFTTNGNLYIGTDEDQSAFRTVFEITEGPHAGFFDAGEFGWTVPIRDLPDGVLNGPTAYGGYACPGGPNVPDPSIVGPLGPGEEAILVAQRGPVADPNNPFQACFFSEKVEVAQEAGWDAVIIANHHVGASEGLTPNAFICGSMGHTFDVRIPGVCVGHRAMHLIFDQAAPDQTYPPDYSVPYPQGDPGDVEPDIGDVGWDVRAEPGQFDGWGYPWLVDAQTHEIRDTLTFPQQHSEQIAANDNTIDLSIHEVAIEKNPTRFGRQANFAWYNGGFRVACYNPRSLTEVGHYIPEGGHDLWGVELFQPQGGRRLVGVSDRDFGLFIYKYTGPECP